MTSEQLMLGLLAAGCLYHLCPFSARGWFLTAGSLALIAAGGKQALFFLFVTVLSTWCGGLMLEQIEKKPKSQDPARRKQEKAKRIRQKKGIAAGILLLNFGLLVLLRHHAELVNIAAEKGLRFPRLFMPIGISFYTFMAMGYLLDVYRAKIPAEKNPIRVAAFVSFFPHLLEGPIGRYDQLAGQLWKGHRLDLEDLERGLLRIAWGLFKKKVVADRALPAVQAVFDGGGEKSGILLLMGLLLYSLQQYADFSGGIDLVLGGARLMGIHLAENFRQPYFADSLGDFWRRWHITLGAWMRDYVFYPFALSSPVQKICKRVKKIPGGKHLSRTLPAVLGNILVFFLVGIWHGTTVNYALWGLYNGIILACSALFEPAFKRWGERHPVANSTPFHIFRILRTFVIVNLGWIFDRSLYRSAFEMLRILFNPMRFGSFKAAAQTLGLTGSSALILLYGTALLFLVSFMKEKGKDPYNWLMKLHVPVRWCLLLGFLVSTVFLFEAGITEGFLYAAF